MKLTTNHIQNCKLHVNFKQMFIISKSKILSKFIKIIFCLLFFSFCDVETVLLLELYKKKKFKRTRSFYYTNRFISLI